MNAICGLSCSDCALRKNCGGCAQTNGHPFGGSCMIALCCTEKRCKNCGRAFEAPCTLKKQLVKAFNQLGIDDMEEVTDLYALHGAYINLQYTLPGGQKIKFWDDDRVYLGNQIGKKNSDRHYGLTADENYLLVCEYGKNGADAQIIVFKKRSECIEPLSTF